MTSDQIFWPFLTNSENIANFAHILKIGNLNFYKIFHFLIKFHYPNYYKSYMDFPKDIVKSLFDQIIIDGATICMKSVWSLWEHKLRHNLFLRIIEHQKWIYE